MKNRKGVRTKIVSKVVAVSALLFLLTGCAVGTNSLKPVKVIKYMTRISVTPSTNLRDGERVLVKVVGASPGERFRISECGSSTDANVYGCGDQLALQPFIDTRPTGTGSITFHVKVNAAIGQNNASVFQSCKDQCVIMAGGTDADGRSALLQAPLKLSP